MNRILGVIPVRYQSSRFPGKPLAKILGKPMIRWVYEGAKQSRLLNEIVIATDDKRIFIEAEKMGARAMMTSPHHASGTERVAEAAESDPASIVINIQGDEPLINGEVLDALITPLQDGSVQMATLIVKNYDISLLADSHIVKVVVDKHGNALYFSRSPLPHGASDFFFQHVGLYGYQKEFLMTFRSLPPSRLERVERLEQLRALEHGAKIKAIEISHPALSVDTPQDIIKVEDFLRKRGHE